MTHRYHHGNLRQALLDRTAIAVSRHGVAGVSLRAIAAAEGVSHTAARHHFGSREGLLTALATEGYDLLHAALAATRRSDPGDYLSLGVTYVEFALDHPGHFAVMFDPDVIEPEDEALTQARSRAFATLEEGARDRDLATGQDAAAATIAGWALMHGLVTLYRGEALSRSEVVASLGTPGLAELARRAGALLGRSTGEST